MKTPAVTLTCLMTLATLLPQNSSAIGGKWTPEQILEHDPAWLRELGLELAPSELWDRDEGGGLLEAIVQVGGCSSGFVSAEGLIITNHHCAFGMLQEHSTPERDLIAEGFLAKDRSEELASANARATVPHRFTDVTAEVEAAVPEGADDYERFHAIDRKKKELVAACEQQAFRRCRVAVYDDGLRYVLIEALEFRDVRLVYTPPRGVGEYGGDVDNWMWPRHTGDFALLRLYAGEDNQPSASSPENRPYRPGRHLPIARQGVADGDFVMVVGYPGLTYRALVAEEMAERNDLFFPRRAALYRDWMDVMEEASENDEAAAIALASRLKSLANREKNYRGQVRGIARGRLLEKKRALEKEVLAWAANQEEHRAAVDAHRELSDLVIEARESTWDRDFLLAQLDQGPRDLTLALALTRWALEKAKPDMERHEDYQERERDTLLRDQKRDQKQLHGPTEQRLLEDVLTRLAGLPRGQRVAAVDGLLNKSRSQEAIRHAARKLTATTKVHDLDERLKMFEESEAQLRERRDPLLDFAFELNRDVLDSERREQTHDGAAARLRPAWRRAVAAHSGKPLDPDANGTLRVSLAHVQGYRPRDGIFMEPNTRVSGIVEKHTGKAPFDAPAPVLAAAGQAPQSRWAEPRLEDVSVCFLATGDTTGGSSGSPVLNGRGELVGVNFDRVWENIANDFGYNPLIARNISADVRYLLWLLEETSGPEAARLLEELGVK